MLIFVMCTLCALILGVCGGNWPLAFIVFTLGLFFPILTAVVALIKGISQLISTCWRIGKCD